MKALAVLAIVLAACGPSCEGGTIATATTIGGYDSHVVTKWGYQMNFEGKLEYGPRTAVEQVWNPDKVVTVTKCLK